MMTALTTPDPGRHTTDHVAEKDQAPIVGDLDTFALSDMCLRAYYQALNLQCYLDICKSCGISTGISDTEVLAIATVLFDTMELINQKLETQL